MSDWYILPEEQESLQEAVWEEGFTLHLLSCFSIGWWIVLPWQIGWMWVQKEKVRRCLVTQKSCFYSYKSKSTTHLSPFSWYGKGTFKSWKHQCSELCFVPSCVTMFESLLSLWISSAMLWFTNVSRVHVCGWTTVAIFLNRISTSWGRPNPITNWAKACVQYLFFTELLLLEAIVLSWSKWAHATEIGTTV